MLCRMSKESGASVQRNKNILEFQEWKNRGYERTDAHVDVYTQVMTLKCLKDLVQGTCRRKIDETVRCFNRLTKTLS